MPTFILNDENKTNSYGFKIPNKGIDLKRFKANPVILDQHYNSTSAVIGKWENMRIEEGQLLADAVFDKEDEQAAKIAGKIDRGFIKGASMGVSFARDMMKQNPDGNWELAKCELFEASIVAVPSNSNALRLYAQSGDLIPENEVRLSIQELQKTEFQLHNQTKMHKITLSALALAALGLESAADESAVNTAILNLQKQVSAKDTAITTLQSQVDAVRDEKIKNLIDTAVAQGKLSATTKEQFTEMAKTNFALAEQVINGLTARQTLGDKVKNSATHLAIKTDEDFMKLSYAEQLAWKDAHPEAYQKMFA